MSKTILLVEDEPAVGRAIQKVLEHNGYEVVLAGTVREARDVLNGQSIDLCITDLALPGETGLDLMKEIRSSDRLRDLPVIVLSGFAVSFQKEVLALCPLRIFQKPPPFAELLSTVREGLGLSP